MVVFADRSGALCDQALCTFPMNFALAARISFLHRKSASPKLLILVQAQNRDRAATDSAAMAEPRMGEEPGNGSELRRHYLLMKPNDATDETTAGKLLQTKATTVRKLYDDVVERLLKAYLIEQECELLRIEQEVRIRDKPSVWVCLWDARDPDCDEEIPPEFIQDDTNLYFVVTRHIPREYDSTPYSARIHPG